MAIMEHHQTQNQRLQTFERLQRLKRSTRPERILPLFSFVDHEEALQSFEEADKFRQQQQRKKMEEEERLRIEEKRRRMEIKERIGERDMNTRGTETRSEDDYDNNENAEKENISGHAGEENDQAKLTLAQPYTPDRPIGQRKIDSGFGLGSGSGPGIVPDTYNTKRTPSTAQRTLYTESSYAETSDTSDATAATTPEDDKGQEQVQRHARAGSTPVKRILETPTKQDRRIITRPIPDRTACETSKQVPKKAFVLPPRPKRGEFATTRAVDEPIESWYFLVRECLQCEIAGVKCGRQIPTCTQCQRRFDVNVKGYRVLNSSGSNSGGKYGFGEWSRPDGICSAGGKDARSQCLVQRRWHARDLVKTLGLPDKREAVLIRLESDSDAGWEGKLREAARLLDVYRTQRERRNWALPSQAGRIAGFSAPKAVAENDRLYKKKREEAMSSFQKDDNSSNSDSNMWKLTIGGPRAIKLKVRNHHEALKKVSVNDDDDEAQPWWEEHLTYEEQRKRQRERWIEKSRQRRLWRSWMRDKRRRGDGLGTEFDADSNSDSDSGASVDSFMAGSVHLGLKFF